MDFVYRLKDSVVQYLSPPQKRRRTTGPGTPSNDARQETILAPASEPQDRKAQAAVRSRVNKKYLSPSDTKNPRKRIRDEFEDQDNEDGISPDDSISQVTPVGSGDESLEEQEISASEELDGSEEEVVEVEGSLGTVDSTAATDENEEVEEGEDEEMVVEEDSENGDDEMEVDEDVEMEIGEDEEIDGEEEVEDDEEINIEEHSEVEVGENEEFEATEDEEDDEEEVEVEVEEEEEMDEDETDLEAREEASAEAKVQEYLARQAELALRREEVEKAKAAGDWHPDEIFLFERLAMRSFEELIPSEWQIDFPTLPQILFTDDDERTFVKTNCRPFYSGVKALQRLLNLGVRVRDRIRTVGRPEKLIAREIRAHIKWSELDGGFRKMRFIPVLAVVSARPKQTTDSISTAITNQLMFLAQKHREYLAVLPEGQLNSDGHIYRRQPPLLYGIIVAQSMIIFVTLDSAKPEAKVRHLTHFDFKEKDMDVWNGFAIAFIVTMSKNYIMSIKDDLEVDDAPTTDEDA